MKPKEILESLVENIKNGTDPKFAKEEALYHFREYLEGKKKELKRESVWESVYNLALTDLIEELKEDV